MGTRRISHALDVAVWNLNHPPGTPVRYWPVLPPVDSAPPVDTRTRSEAWELGDGSPVVLIDGKSGGVHLAHLTVRIGKGE